MIRRIILYISLSFITFWFTGVYLIKYRVAALIKNSGSDNIKLSYDDIRVSGFPSRWEIRIIAPKVTFIDSINSRELSSKSLFIYLTSALKKPH